MKVFSLFFALRQRKRHAVSQYTRSPSTVQWYKLRPPTASKNNIGLSAETAKSAGRGGRPIARTTAHGLCGGSIGLLRLPASAPQARACEAVLRLLPNESESGIVAQWPCLTLSLVSARAASDFRGCGCCKHTLFQTNKIYWVFYFYFDSHFFDLEIHFKFEMIWLILKNFDKNMIYFVLNQGIWNLHYLVYLGNKVA